MNHLELIMKYFWIILIIVTIANAVMMKAKSKKYIEQDSSLKPGYEAILKGFIILGNTPWIIMGLGILTGSVPNVFHYFRPRDGNPFVIAFFISAFLIWILVTYWLFLKNGAEMLVRHPGLLNCDFTSPYMYKLFWILCLAGGIVGVITLFTTDVKIPNIR